MGQYRLARLQTWIAGAATLIAGVGTLFLVWTFRETKRTADAAMEANKISRETYVADQRPWVSMVPEPESSLRFDRSQALMMVNLTIKNSGKTPATKVAPHVELIVLTDCIRGMMKTLENFCEKVQTRNYKGPLTSYTIFPSDPFPTLHFVSASLDTGGQANIMIGGKPYVFLVCLVCIEYEFAVPSRVHRTAAAYALLKRDETGFPNAIPSDQGDVPIQDLGFSLYPGASLAD